METRWEKDSLGEKEVPRKAYYGIQTSRALENFSISGLKPHPRFVEATVLIKKASAEANTALGMLEPDIGKAVIQAANEVLEGRLREQFVIDVFQAGAGTSHNMNANEVLANRAIEILGGTRGNYMTVHPNDHVNMGQSTNDVFPTAMRLASLFLLQELLPAVESLGKAFRKKSKEFSRILKSGRTHLQDAVPLSLGQEFGAYATTLRNSLRGIQASSEPLKELGIGGNAVGTGLNTPPQYRQNVTDRLKKYTRLDLFETKDLFAATQSMAPFVRLSGELKGLALELIRIANDLRLLSSGPRTGLAEIELPAVQPGSSMMPGKVNPVMAEAMNMVAFQVIGNDLTISLASQAGQLELNVMMPVINYNLLQSLQILTNVLTTFQKRCVEGIKANAEKCRDYLENSLGLATVLNPVIGYEAAARVAKQAHTEGKSLREVILKEGLLRPEELERILSPASWVGPEIEEDT